MLDARIPKVASMLFLAGFKEIRVADFTGAGILDRSPSAAP
jgi:hypothetical protein